MRTSTCLEYSDFEYIGDRSYIQGSAILDFFLKYAKKYSDFIPLPEYIISFAINQEVTEKNGCWIHLEKVKNTEKHNLAATLKYLDASGLKNEMGFIVNGHPITAEKRRAELPSNISTYGLDGDFQGKAQLIASTFSEFFRGLILINKKLHIDTLSGLNISTKGIQLIYIEKLPVIDSLKGMATQIDIITNHRKRMKSKDRTYTLNEIIFEWKGKKHTSMICYSF